MNLRLVHPFLLASAVVLLSATVSEARCLVDVEGHWRVTRKFYPNISVFQILVETVDRVANGQFATGTVQRVWQGHTPRQLTLYNDSATVLTHALWSLGGVTSCLLGTTLTRWTAMWSSQDSVDSRFSISVAAEGDADVHEGKHGPSPLGI